MVCQPTRGATEILVVVLVMTVRVVLLLSVPDGITRAVSKSSRGREEEEDGT